MREHKKREGILPILNSRTNEKAALGKTITNVIGRKISLGEKSCISIICSENISEYICEEYYVSNDVFDCSIKSPNVNT